MICSPQRKLQRKTLLLRLELNKLKMQDPIKTYGRSLYFNDKTLIDMCVKLPADREDLLKVSGVGASKLEKYGERFLDAIQMFLSTRT